MHTQVGFVRLVSTQLVLRRPSSQAKVEQTSTPNSEIATATREASMSGKMRIAPAFKLKSICRYPIFGPAPILDSEDSEAYEFLVARLYADLKPADIVEEGYLQDIAYWTWEIRRWRRMKVCLIETERVKHMGAQCASSSTPCVYWRNRQDRYSRNQTSTNVRSRHRKTKGSRRRRRKNVSRRAVGRR